MDENQGRIRMFEGSKVTNVANVANVRMFECPDSRMSFLQRRCGLSTLSLPASHGCGGQYDPQSQPWLDEAQDQPPASTPLAQKLGRARRDQT